MSFCLPSTIIKFNNTNSMITNTNFNTKFVAETNISFQNNYRL